MTDIDTLAEKLAPHYSRFRVTERLLFSGHSHQAWPDVAREGLQESFDVAAEQVDNKWDAAEKKTEKLRAYLRDFYDDPDGLYCRGQNTHELLVSWLSSFNLRDKPKVITTTGEFHSMHRQLHRLKEEGLTIAELPVEPLDDFTKRLERHIDGDTAAIMLSRVFFETALINPHLPEIAALARQASVPLLIDDYHGTNVVPLSLRENGLEDCYILIGGYKYLQWGEGNCFLRFPQGCNLRPAITGWFASFSTLDKPRTGGPVHFDEGNQRFSGATFDPASQFRAARVVDFFREQNLTPEVLREQYKAQIGLIRKLFLEQDFDPDLVRLKHSEPLERNGGFLALESPYARELRARLLEREVFTDARGSILRLGPAPYTTTRQIEAMIGQLAECVKSIGR